MKKKIGIITILKVGNYGAELQAYATQAILKKLGYDAEIIDYLFYKHPHHKKTKRSTPILPFTLSAKLKEWFYPKLSKLKSFRYKDSLKKREERFSQFHIENTSMSTTYRSIDELYATKMNYDVYMVGSDQVWNPGVYSNIEPYFLTFAPLGARRVAYASSFGVEILPEGCKTFYRELLSKFDAIGVREEKAVNITNEICKKNIAQWVLDPTLLLSSVDWASVNKPIRIAEKQYILLYELTPCEYIRELAYYFHNKLGLPIVRICKNAAKEERSSSSIVNIIDAGPAEYLSAIENASLVLTNSFHGTAFSINFSKDFYVITPRRKHNNSRQQSLTRLFGLENRLLIEGAEFPAIEKLKIDYEKVSLILEQERDKSIKFLINAIDGE